MKGITDREKASLYFQVLERCDDWRKIYRLSMVDDRYNNMQDKAQQTSASRWKNSFRIQSAHEEIKRNLNALIQEERQKAVNEYLQGESENTQRKPKESKNNGVNFLDRDEFLRFLNDRANEIKDDKLRNDILKMLSDNLRYKDSEQGETEQIRAYLPVNCHECELYKRCKSCKFDVCEVEAL